MIGCIGDDIATRNIIRQVICEDLVNSIAEDPYTHVGLSIVGSIENFAYTEAVSSCIYSFHI